MKTYISIIIFTVLMISCSKDSKIDWDLKPHADLLVVESLLTSDTANHFIHLTLSNPYYDSKDPRTVSEATVFVTEGSKVYSFVESSETKGLYYSTEKFSGKPGKTYDLTIKLKYALNGKDEFKSSAKMPEGLKIDSIKCEIYEMPDLEDQKDKKEKDTTILAVYYFGGEPKVATNYYLARTYRNSQPLQSNSKEFLTYESHEDKNYTHLATFGKNVSGDDLITFKLYTIDRSYYRYLEAISNMDQTGMATSLSGPPANAVGNVPNALGYFVVAFVSKATASAEDLR